MDTLGILLIALALSADAFAASVAIAGCAKKDHLRNAILCAVFFGGFQALMPLIGWFLGASANAYVEKLDHWIAFLLLAFIGTKMMFDSFKKDDENSCERFGNTLGIKTLFVLAIATSIDALAVGVSFGCLNTGIVKPAIIIGIVTAIISVLGSTLGKKIGEFAKSKAEFFGGLVLFIIGLKILVEHIFGL